MERERARALLHKQFTDGPLPMLEAQALRAAIRNDPALKAEYDRLVDLEQALHGDDSAAVARMLARGAPALPATRRPARRWWVGLAAAAAVAVGVMLAQREAPTPTPPALQAKGGGAAVNASVRLFRKVGKAKPQRLGKRLGAADGLLVSYTTPKQGGPSHLAVVARDAAGAVHWILPTWTDPKAAPSSATIRAGVADHEVPRVVFHDYAAGPMQVCAVFTKGPRSVPAWDAQLSKAWPPKGGQCQTVQVTP